MNHGTDRQQRGSGHADAIPQVRDAPVADTPGTALREELLRRLDQLPASHPSSPRYRTSPGYPSPERRGSGWDAPEVAQHPDRPSPESIRLPPDRVAHILDGDGDGTGNGGGHRHGTGRPGKTEFPADWDDKKITSTILDVARDPSRVHQQWNTRWKGRGEREGVTVTVIINTDGNIWTAWPEPGGRGVTTNPRNSPDE